MSPRSRSVASSPLAAMARVCSPWVDTRAAKSTSESAAECLTISTVTSERKVISGAVSLTLLPYCPNALSRRYWQRVVDIMPTMEVAMDFLTALAIALGLLALTTAIGIAWRAGQGAVEQRADKGVIPGRLRSPGSAITLLQVSGEMCSYCAAMRRILSHIGRTVSDVGHVEIDIADEPELVSSLRITQTPTTLLVDPSGNIVSWIRGAASPQVVTEAITTARERLQEGSHDWSI